MGPGPVGLRGRGAAVCERGSGGYLVHRWEQAVCWLSAADVFPGTSAALRYLLRKLRGQICEAVPAAKLWPFRKGFLLIRSDMLC